MFKGIKPIRYAGREVLPLMRVGDTWKVYLPPAKAYGERAPRAIGPNQALVFDIQLVSIK